MSVDTPTRMKCPQCGYEMEPRRQPDARASLLFWVILVVLCLAIWVASDRIWGPN